MPRWLARIASAGFILCAAAACRRSSPPFDAFEVTLEVKPAKGRPAATPPDGALRPWRVWVNQERPRQKKAPTWRVYGAKEGAFLDLAADGKWQCLVNPVKVFGKVNERAKIADWIVSRTVRCSCDGWRAYVDGFVQASFDAEGKETETTPSAALYLNDTVGGAPRATVVVLEGEKTVRGPLVE